jgi:uncharacterized protein YggE
MMTPQRCAAALVMLFLFTGSLVSLSAGPSTSLRAGALTLQEPAQRDARREPVVVTTGSAVLRRAPDRAFVNIGAEARAAAPQAAQAQNAKTMTAVRERLKAFGIPDQAIETRALDLQPEFDYADGRQKLRGYVARNILEVRLDDVARVGEVIDASVAAGANAVHDVRFDLKDRTGVEREALKAAVADALGRATALAAGAGKTVDRIVTIEEHRAEVIPLQRSAMFARADAAPAPTPVAPGEVEIRASVTLTAAIK